VITVLQTATAHSGNEFETPPPGGHFLAVKVKECAGTTQEFVSESSWSVKLVDFTQVDAGFMSGATPGPELPSSNLQPSACTAGWVYFPLPPSPAVTEIHLNNADFFWTLG
jgi:hypothetical protein